MTVREFDPLTDPHWSPFLLAHPDAGIFHSRAWLEVLRSSYGYKAIAFTTSPADELTHALVCCEIQSRFTGRRLVSLPFSDHCQPLANGDALEELIEYLAKQRVRREWKYVELRPVDGFRQDAFHASTTFYLHRIDLRPSLDELHARLHSSCIQRKIRKAERHALVYEAGRSEALLEQFRSLLLLTRRRHQLPPQPRNWFRKILLHLGRAVTIHMMSKDGQPIASLMTLQHKRVLTYKYGCSDSAFGNLGATPLLFWRAIQQAKADGMEIFDLGRSDLEESGLTLFKEHLGAAGSELVYLRSPDPSLPKSALRLSSDARTWARRALVRLPDPIFSGVGELVYRHLG